MGILTLDRLEDRLGRLEAEYEELEDVQSGRDSCPEYADDPVGFMRDVLGFEPWWRQVEMSEAVLDSPKVAVRSCHAMGKDAWAARLALWWVYARDGLALISGPTARQVETVLFRTEMAMGFHGAGLKGRLLADRLDVGRGEQRGVLGFTSSAAGRLSGFHAPRVLVVITEAAAVEEFAWEGLLSCATGAEDRLVVLGNPIVTTGRFRRVCDSPAWRTFKIPASEHPNVVEGRTLIPGGVTREWVESVKEDWGEDSDYYRSRVDAEWPDQDIEGLLKRSWLEAAADRWSEGLADPTKAPVVSIDPGHSIDPTGIAVRYGRRIDSVGDLFCSDAPAAAERVYRERVLPLWKPTGPQPRMIVDAVGLGDPWADCLAKVAREHPLPACPLIRYKGSHKSSGDRYLNRRAESHLRLRKMLRDGELDLPYSERLFEDLLAVRYGTNTAGRLVIEAKDDVKGRLGRSPDQGDAVVMAADYGSRRIGHQLVQLV